jgi:hypothetical protein
MALDMYCDLEVYSECRVDVVDDVKSVSLVPSECGQCGRASTDVAYLWQGSFEPRLAGGLLLRASRASRDEVTAVVCLELQVCLFTVMV